MPGDAGPSHFEQIDLGLALRRACAAAALSPKETVNDPKRYHYRNAVAGPALRSRPATPTQRGHRLPHAHAGAHRRGLAALARGAPTWRSTWTASPPRSAARRQPLVREQHARRRPTGALSA